MNTISFTCGLISACVSQATDCLHPCLKNAETSCKDIWLFAIQEVGIVTIICLTILLAGWYIIDKIYKSNKSKHQEEKNDADQKRINDKEDREFRQKAICEDRKQKRIESLQDTMITYMENRIKEGKTIDKDDPLIAKLTEMIKNYTTTEDKGHQEAPMSNTTQE